jgi:hypothetical protein
MSKKEQKMVVTAAVAVAVVGIVIAEFAPGIFAGSMGEGLSGPFGSYRNGLALRWGVIGAVLGAVAGFGWAKLKK